MGALVTGEGVGAGLPLQPVRMVRPGTPAWMGFDPRRGRTPPSGRPITANVDALLAENEALRQEVWALRQQLELLRHLESNRVSASTKPGISGEAVERWCQAMAHHPSWATLRVGPPGGLRALMEELRRHSWTPSLSLEEELDRQSPGLGGELAAALRGPHSRGRWAVRAAFALYGLRAEEWLQEEPLRVVDELRQRVERLDRRRGNRQEQGQGHQNGQEQEQGQGQGHQQSPGQGQGRQQQNRGHGQDQGRGQDQDQGRGQGQGHGQDQGRGHDQGRGQGQGQGQGQGRRRGTRTANHSQGHRQAPRGASGAGADATGTGGPSPGASAGAGNGAGSGAGEGVGAGGEPAGGPGLDPRRLEALQLLGLELGASPRAIKRAYWRLAKAHHPDLGGDPEAFHRLEAAYRLLAG